MPCLGCAVCQAGQLCAHCAHQQCKGQCDGPFFWGRGLTGCDCVDGAGRRGAVANQTPSQRAQDHGHPPAPAGFRRDGGVQASGSGCPGQPSESPRGVRGPDGTPHAHQQCQVAKLDGVGVPPGAVHADHLHLPERGSRRADGTQPHPPSAARSWVAAPQMTAGKASQINAT
jgi:hypothetical protein